MLILMLNLPPPSSIRNGWPENTANHHVLPVGDASSRIGYPASFSLGLGRSSCR